VEEKVIKQPDTEVKPAAAKIPGVERTPVQPELPGTVSPVITVTGENTSPVVSLDSADLVKKLDRAKMAGHLTGLPETLYRAWQAAEAFPLPPAWQGVKRVMVLGMGGSAIAADLARGLVNPAVGELVTVRDYTLPGPLDEATLVIGSSYSGETEETLSAFKTALAVPGPRMAITTGGRLKAMAEAAGAPVFVIDYKAPPRAALAWGLLPLLSFLRRLGLVEIREEGVKALSVFIRQLSARYGDFIPERVNLAKQLARQLHKQFAVIYGGGFLAPVAFRWKTQINENSKNWAFAEALPEANHNAVNGFEWPENIRRQGTVVILNSNLLHERVALRNLITGEILARQHVRHETVTAEGPDMLTQIMSLVFLGDWVSYYLALLNGVDPTPVDVITYLKKRLG
jgi:glucose/mannose-6-phosphate isomerase